MLTALTTGHFIYSSEGKMFKLFGPDDNDGLSLLKSDKYTVCHWR